MHEEQSFPSDHALFHDPTNGESIQVVRHCIQKDMRATGIYTSEKVKGVTEIVAIHLFARGLQSAPAHQRVLEMGDKTLAKAAA